jgi:hypothetical protein
LLGVRPFEEKRKRGGGLRFDRALNESERTVIKKVN